ncbi:hypothetical protein [Actinoplanes derwentensis]|uniref:Uncharacterized protein n=1 Tax=Actinoplanes derwentensis TaxID=113562 RepID=A0A1H2D1U0_9ACTN|nr:hypothetical protein [Actinoplanes derwentensis]GID86832.1 hypothetical protein Ade03nite_57560 [Actinoplanes derwentensis]SDT76730.1 hypothetical protein SAMN04489716_7714 [Actinoplanes derwentensis]
MKRRSAALIVTAGVLVAIAVGSGLSAWAGWSVGSTTGLATVTADTLPTVTKPKAVLRGDVPEVGWKAVEFPSGAALRGYVVFRHTGGTRAEVCRTSATVLNCTDAAVKAGSTVAYTVRATAGDRWTGAASPISRSVVVPQEPTAGLAVKKPGAVETEGAEETGTADPSTGPDDTRSDSKEESEPVASPSATPTPSAVPTSVAPSPTVTAVEPSAG